MSDNDFHRAPKFERVRLHEGFQPPLSDVAMANDLRSYIWDKSSDGLFPRYVPSAEALEGAADLLERLYERLSLAVGVIDQSGIIWMGEAETKKLLAKARGER